MLQRHLYEIVIIRHKDGEILDSKRMVATSTESAMAKADMPAVCKDNNITSDDVEFVILKLGSLRAIEEVKQTDISGV